VRIPEMTFPGMRTISDWLSAPDSEAASSVSLTQETFLTSS